MSKDQNPNDGERPSAMASIGVIATILLLALGGFVLALGPCFMAIVTPQD